ncbi:MAG: glycoside hydrolase family 5 protein [Oscillospiraceae bacterium]|nr:glycoside hydrolase family 5 protein [Oscillospiraceae bacterium]
MGGHFRIKGTKIICPDGSEFHVRGVNVNGPGWVFPRDTLQDVGLILDVWRFNSVRLCAAMGWEFAAGNNPDLDGLIKAFTDRGAPVILEVHDYTGTYPPAVGYRKNKDSYMHDGGVLKEWWADKARRYKGNPYVWFNIMNEPGPDDSRESAESWLKAHDEVIGAIRAEGAENVIVLDEHQWGQGSGYRGGKGGYASAVIRMGPTLNAKYGNLLYSLHVYDSWYGGERDFDAYFSDARDAGLCVFLGEFGVGRGNVSQHSAIRAMYDSSLRNGVGRMYWAWDDAGLPLTEAERGCGWAIDRTDGGRPGNLTWVGGLVWDDNRFLLEGSVPGPGLPTLPNGDFSEGMVGWQGWGRGSSVKGGSDLGRDGNVLVIGFGGAGGAGRILELRRGARHRLSAWGRNSSAANMASTIGVAYSSACEADRQTHHTLAFTSNTWEAKSLEFTVPDDLALAPSIYVWKMDANTIFYAADIRLEEVTAAD